MSTTNSGEHRKSSLRAGTIKLAVALSLAVLAWSWVGRYESGLRALVQLSERQAVVNEEPSAAELKERVEALSGINELMINWALLVFAATLGVAVLGRAVKISDRNWGLVLMPSIWVLLYNSLNYGFRSKGGLRYKPSAFSEASVLITLQRDCFIGALVVVALFAVWHLFFRFSLMEEQRAAE